MAYQKDFKEYKYKLRLGLSLLVIGYTNATTHHHVHHTTANHGILKGCFHFAFLVCFFCFSLSTALRVTNYFNKKTSAVVQRFDGCILKFKIMP